VNVDEPLICNRILLGPKTLKMVLGNGDFNVGDLPKSSESPSFPCRWRTGGPALPIPADA